MASRGRFKIPSAQELKDTDEPKLKPSSLFKAYKESTAKDATVSKEKQGQSDLGNVLEKPSSVPSTSDIINRAPAVTMPTSTTSVTMATTNTAESGQNSTAGASKNLSPNTIIVNFRQRGNPLLKHIRNVPWEYASIVPDYVMGRANCALFLSLRYHQLHPDYLHSRLKELGKGYDLRILLVQVDVKEPHHLLKELTKICILADLTLILAFSAEEAGRYLEAYKVYENKTAEALMERTDPDYVSKVTDCLTTVKSVNKTDSMSLLTTFKSMESIINASKEDIAMCAGFGPQKAQRLYDVFREPFLKSKKRQATNHEDASFSPEKKPR